ncbi:MAG: hypothetical protein OHK93_003762 [Ramalina farinacea]|uniref:BTB domain-containing protein n=1 Tax=Ramalina farinacea TaxID=258253 RepID=A0AA43QX43_9LECA|nr:hypothetical protein [Ramalina farinacea]
MAHNEEYATPCSSGLGNQTLTDRSPTSIYSSPIFTFRVGGKPLYAHQALVSKHSKPLDRLMNADMKEKEERTATLADVEPATFARFLEWAYKGYYTPAPHTMDELPAALSEVNGIQKEQKDFAGMFSTEPLLTATRDGSERLTPRAASLLRSESPTQGNPPAPFPRPPPQPAAAALTAAPVGPTATAPTSGLFGSTPALPGNSTTTGSTASSLFSSSGRAPVPTTSAPASNPTPNPANNTRSPFSFGTAPTSASTTATSSSTTATATTSPIPVLAVTRPASAHGSAAATGTTVGSFGSTRPASASSTSDANPNVAGGALFGSRPAPTTSASTAGSTTAPASASNVPSTNPNTAGASGFGSAAGLFGSRPAPTSSAPPAFGSSTTPAPAPNTSKGSLFDRPSSGGGFGAASTFTTLPGTGLFGSSNAAPSSTNNSSLFGNAAPSSNTSLFGNVTPSSNPTTSSLFANPAPTSTTNTSNILADPPTSSNTDRSGIFASRATPAFGGFGAPPTAPPSLTQPTGLFGRSPSPSGATATTTADRQRSPSPFGGKESNAGFGSTSSTQRPLFVSAKDQLKEAFIRRQPKVLRSVIEIPPTRGNWLRENHTDVLLSHAQLYVFADEQDIQPLKTLALESLHVALSLFFLYPGRTKDIVSLLRYSYDNTADFEGHRDELRDLLTEYMGLEMEILVKDKGLRDLMTKDDDGIGQEERAALLGDFMAVVAKRL